MITVRNERKEISSNWDVTELKLLKNENTFEAYPTISLNYIHQKRFENFFWKSVGW